MAWALTYDTFWFVLSYLMGAGFLIFHSDGTIMDKSCDICFITGKRLSKLLK